MIDETYGETEFHHLCKELLFFDVPARLARFHHRRTADKRRSDVERLDSVVKGWVGEAGGGEELDDLKLDDRTLAVLRVAAREALEAAEAGGGKGKKGKGQGRGKKGGGAKPGVAFARPLEEILRERRQSRRACIVHPKIEDLCVSGWV